MQLNIADNKLTGDDLKVLGDSDLKQVPLLMAFLCEVCSAGQAGAGRKHKHQGTSRVVTVGNVHMNAVFVIVNTG